MNKTEIFNQYAIEQGYEDWRELVMSHVVDFDGVLTYEDLIQHFNNVTDLIQEELKKKCAKVAFKKFLERHINWGHLENSILNTEIL